MKSKRTKFWCLLVVFITLFQLTAIVSLASNDSESSDYESYLVQKNQALTQARAQSTTTDGTSNNTYETASALVTAAMLLLPDTTISEDRKNQFKLTNVLANYHGLNEGNDIIDIMFHAFVAEQQANNYYPNDQWKKDAYRHFAWNFLSTRDLDVSQETTRIYTTCFEWAGILLDDWLNYKVERHNYYLSIGATSPEAKAWADANDFACEAKKYLQMKCLNAHWIFRMAFCNNNTTPFTYDGIMDFRNNREGCEYASENIWQTAKNAFDNAVANGDAFIMVPTYNNVNSISGNMFLSSWWYVIT